MYHCAIKSPYTPRIFLDVEEFHLPVSFISESGSDNDIKYTFLSPD